MMEEIKAIETHYNGYRFRSRLEARYAVLFDNLSIEYEYELEGYDLGEAGYYLPDFWLPKENTFFEVKGIEPNIIDRKKMAMLSSLSKKKVIFSVNSDLRPITYDPNDKPGAILFYFRPEKKYKEYEKDNFEIGIFSMPILHVCERCGAGHFVFNYLVSDIFCEECFQFLSKHQCDFLHRTLQYRQYLVESDSSETKLEDAYHKARSARFEHGETPASCKKAMKQTTSRNQEDTCIDVSKDITKTDSVIITSISEWNPNKHTVDILQKFLLAAPEFDYTNIENRFADGPEYDHHDPDNWIHEETINELMDDPEGLVAMDFEGNCIFFDEIKDPCDPDDTSDRYAIMHGFHAWSILEEISYHKHMERDD